MSELYYPLLFVAVPLIASLTYWAAHDPESIRMAAAWHLYQSQKLNAWAKAQDSRKRVYQKAMRKHAPKPTVAPCQPKAVEA